MTRGYLLNHTMSDLRMWTKMDRWDFQELVLRLFKDNQIHTIHSLSRTYNKTENPPKDALDHSLNYAKLYNICTLPKLTLHNFAFCMIYDMIQIAHFWTLHNFTYCIVLHWTLTGRQGTQSFNKWEFFPLGRPPTPGF